MDEDTKSLDLDDKARLNFTLSIREKAIKEVTGNGNEFPQDTSGRVYLIGLLDGMDRTVLQRAKIRSDENMAQQQQQAVSTIGNLLARISAKPTNVRTTTEISLDPSLKIDDIVPGEIEQGIPSLTYDEFTKE